jgi:GntR family transcriptional repressor for pyruvate dehydrogenase complex
MTTKHDHIADTLTNEVLSGRYQPGDRLPSERDLAIRFDANRGAVREAMTKLAQLGIADIQPGGARVAPIAEASLDIIGCMLASTDVPDANLLNQIFEVVDRLLSMAAETVVERATDEHIEEIRKLVQVLCNGPLDREAHFQARFEMMHAFLVTSENLVCRLIAKSLFDQFAPSAAALDQYYQLDIAAFSVFVRQLDQALASRDRDAVRAIFDGFSGLHRETMMRAIDAASQDNRQQTEVAAS